ncbi:MAG TPA: enoyl-CoA hydratase/isomerase family protein [Acidimicrobiia bacterium]|nr:enoyl-CoA hydratase/isomerase family protein [Acidimicrobiia bacterium]
MRRMSIPDFETIEYDEHDDGVAWVTLARPQVHNAFNSLMQRELHTLWRLLRRHDPVKCIVLTGAGDKAFCTGIDRMEQMGSETDESTDPDVVGSGGTTPFMFNDPGDNIGPKSCDLWKPVIAAVNGMACGGAFYMLGEVEFIIAAEHATFFDPHVTYGMTAAFEPIHMSGVMPFGEIMRLSLLGNHERLAAARAKEIGLVSEVVPASELRERAHWAAAAIASQPRLAIEGTVRAIWGARELGARTALRLGYAYVGLGTNQESIAEGQEMFASGKRIDWRLRS